MQRITPMKTPAYIEGPKAQEKFERGIGAFISGSQGADACGARKRSKGIQSNG
jgi:hypothetical protein